MCGQRGNEDEAAVACFVLLAKDGFSAGRKRRGRNPDG